MKFSVGYQFPDNGESFAEIVGDYREHIAEVYFAWPGAPSGRAALASQGGAVARPDHERFEEEICGIRRMGVRLDLLFNANCYGARALSVEFEKEILSVVGRLKEMADGPDVVTTTSFTVARTLKKHFPEIEVRASVNMRIGEPEAMRYASDFFDSFHIRRDLQRNMGHVRRVKDWCDANGKGLGMLANSGCLYSCPAQSFHDNLVAHDAEIDGMENIPGWTPHLCWNIYGDEKMRDSFLKSTWIRPEDLPNYEGLVSVVKLATRMHSHPRMVIDAYANRSFDGNLLNLMEPCFAHLFHPRIVDNSRFPADWSARTSQCGRACESCGYCAEIFREVCGNHGLPSLSMSST